MNDLGRLEQLRFALEEACADPNPTNLAALGDAFQAVEFSTDEDDDHDVMRRRNDAVETFAIEALGKKLVAQLGESAPHWLRRHVLGE